MVGTFAAVGMAAAFGVAVEPFVFEVGMVVELFVFEVGIVVEQTLELAEPPFFGLERVWLERLGP